MRPVAKKLSGYTEPTHRYLKEHTHLQSTNANTKNEHLRVHKDTHTHTHKEMSNCQKGNACV